MFFVLFLDQDKADFGLDDIRTRNRVKNELFRLNACCDVGCLLDLILLLFFRQKMRPFIECLLFDGLLSAEAGLVEVLRLEHDLALHLLDLSLEIEGILLPHSQLLYLTKYQSYRVYDDEEESLNIFEAENLLDFFIVGVLLADPLWMLSCDLVPQPVSEVGVEEDAGVEAVASLDHLSWLSVVQVHSLEHVFGWEVVVCDIEVLVLLLFYD